MQLEHYRALLTFSRTLSRVSSSAELIEVAVAALREHTPYRAGWIYLYTAEGRVELLETRGEQEEARRQMVTVIDVEDPLVQTVMLSTLPVVIEDAREDPRTDKAIVERLGTRTIVNVPLLLHDEHMGAFGGATYGEQGVRPPSEEELAFMSTMGGLVASVLGRMRVEDRLRASQRLESLGLMAGKIAHDFNNILTVVSSRIDLAKVRNPDDEHLAEASRATRMAADLSHQLLAYSGHARLSSRRFDLGQLVQEMRSLLEASLAPGVLLELGALDAACAVEGDPSQLRQVVHNLVINASDAMKGDGGVVYVEITCDDESVSLVVRDQGVGMEESTRLRIFDPYFTTKASGRGLGMAAVLGICRSHDGTIAVDSAPGAGATFTITFPRTTVERASREIGRRPPASVVGRILVIDDEESVRETMRHVFETAGLSVRTAPLGPEGLRIFEEDPTAIDLVYVDMTMPFMSGVEVLREMGRVQPGVKAILTSGYSELDVSDVGAVDLVGVVPKPPDVARVIDMILGALGAGQ